ncbi:PREDICTED: uncharacterized protein LOC105367984 isoform X2 [Ceratosolen solmsi marchali]|uniref:Uncharacterized protein LOC105367984 isoform X2 n=1 Tax=Ceratosolen solmsi marchali TaxID=326594 RepID=A0AAJ7E280_9HYME|nr:PREDICTED: uncharacterized protein LOC105367984 isoform X2 [Ceratosolen solmsi marchali]
MVYPQEYSYGPFKIIKIPRIQSGRLLPEVLRTKTSNIAETLYFIREAAEDLLTRRAIVYTVEQSPGAEIFKNGLMVLDDDELSHVRKSRTFEASKGSFRIFKKKKNIILPILILLNLLKLKLLIFPIFLGVHFIKKLLILGSLLLPSILSHLKICKIAQQPFPYHHWQPPGAEYALDFSHAYGQQDSWDHRNDVLGNAYDSYYDHSLYNPFSYYFQNYNKERR